MFRNTWHLLHFLLFLFTAGLWLPVWVLRAWLNARHNERVLASMRQPVNVTVNNTQSQVTPTGNPYAGAVDG